MRSWLWLWLSSTSASSSARSTRTDRRDPQPRNRPRAARVGGRGGSARDCQGRVTRRLDSARVTPKIHIQQLISPVPASVRPASSGARDAGVQSRPAPARVQRATKMIIAFLAVAVAVLVPPLLRRFDDMLLDIAAGHRAAWPMGDPLLECAGEADDDSAVTELTAA